LTILRYYQSLETLEKTTVRIANLRIEIGAVISNSKEGRLSFNPTFIMQSRRKTTFTIQRPGYRRVEMAKIADVSEGLASSLFRVEVGHETSVFF
jgi:hypothetical protein